MDSLISDLYKNEWENKEHMSVPDWCPARC